MNHSIMVNDDADVIDIKTILRQAVIMLFRPAAFLQSCCSSDSASSPHLRKTNLSVKTRLKNLRTFNHGRVAATMSKLRCFFVTLMLISAIYQSQQSPVSLLPEHQLAAGGRSPINIIRIKPVDAGISKGNEHPQRKQKSVGKTEASESNPPVSSFIVIKPVLSPVAEYADKKITKRMWKKVMRRPKFLHDVLKDDNTAVTRVARVHLAPGAYPVFYGLAKTNGNFDKIKSITHSSN